MKRKSKKTFLSPVLIKVPVWYSPVIYDLVEKGNKYWACDTYLEKLWHVPLSATKFWFEAGWHKMPNSVQVRARKSNPEVGLIQLEGESVECYSALYAAAVREFGYEPFWARLLYEE